MTSQRPGQKAIGSLVDELRRAIDGEVDDSSLARALYSSDAANYRVVPGAVVLPRTREALIGAVDAARRHGVPVTLRGGGTSMAGNAVGPGLVVDTSRHLHRILAIDPVARTAVVEPGVVLADLNAACAPHGLRFGPDPASGTRATLGGMIGNNACGAHAMSYGRTADNVLSLTWLTGTGEVVTAQAGPDALDAVPDWVRSWTGTSRCSAPSSAGSAARSPATRSSTSCPRTARTSLPRSWGPKARAGCS